MQLHPFSFITETNEIKINMSENLKIWNKNKNPFGQFKILENDLSYSAFFIVQMTLTNCMYNDGSGYDFTCTDGTCVNMDKR